MRKTRLSAVTGRRASWAWIIGLSASLLTVLSPGSTETAVANGDTRTIYLYHAHTHESIAATFKVNGQYDASVLAQLNHFLRDWRNDEEIHMDPHLFDVIWEVYRQSGSQQPIEVLSAYRSPETNAMLRRRTRGVAEHSQHILGHAMDQHYMDVPMSRIRDLGMRLQRGGVGFYPTSGTPFVHLDVGGVRHWPRMSYEQLARLFPDGKTVHIPSNGVPLPGYEEARAELAARGDDSVPSVAEVKSKSFFAWLFGGGGDEQEDNSEAGIRATPAPERVAASAGGADSYGKQDRGDASRFFAGQQAPQSVTPARPVAQAAAVAPSTRALQQRLAPAMAAAQPEPSAGGATLQEVAPAQAAAASPVDETPAAPLPPRRPVELAILGPGAPLPPSRPPELSLGPHDALAHAGPAPDAIAAMLTTGRGPLPSVITQGTDRVPKPGGVPLAYAPQVTAGQVSPAAPRAIVPVPVVASRTPEAVDTVPLPVARPPDLVSAHLDRSNFGSLTRPVRSELSLSRTALGTAMPPVRAAASSRASFDAFVPLPQARPTTFGAQAPVPSATGFTAGHGAATSANRATSLD